MGIPSVCLIDGDSRQAESASDRVYRLPGQSPEVHVLGEVMEAWASYGGKLAVALLQKYEHADRVRETIESIRLTNRDPHVIFSQIGERLGLIPETTVIAAFANIWAQAHEHGCAAIAEPIRQLLPGDTQPNQPSQPIAGQTGSG